MFAVEPEDNLCTLRALSMTRFAAFDDETSNAGGRVTGTLLGGPSGDLARLAPPGLSFTYVTLVGDVVKCGGVIAILPIGDLRSSASAARNAARAASLARAMASDIPTPRTGSSYPPLSLFPTTRNVNSSSLPSSSLSSSSSRLLTADANRRDAGPGDDANAATSRIARMFEIDDDVIVVLVVVVDAPIHSSLPVIARTIRPSSVLQR